MAEAHEKAGQIREDAQKQGRVAYIGTFDQYMVSEEINVPMGSAQMCILEVFIFSYEYPFWTGMQSIFNDILSWEIDSSWGDSIGGSVEVNSLHDKFEEGDNGYCILARYAIHCPEKINTGNIKITLFTQNIEDGLYDTRAGVNMITVKMLPEAEEIQSNQTLSDSSKKNLTSQQEQDYPIIPVDTPPTVYIENNNDNGAPYMPQMKYRTEGVTSGKTVTWFFNSKSERSKRGNRDDISIPASGSGVTINANTIFHVNNYLETLPADKRIFGGNAKIDLKIDEVLSEAYSLKIRGKNPDDFNVERFIIQQCALHGITEYFNILKAIARHESKDANSPNKYNQFNRLSMGGDLSGTANWGYPDGWGIMQLDPTGSGINVTTELAYNWQANVKKGVEYFKSCRMEAISYFNAIQRTFPDQYEPYPNTYSVPNTNIILPALDTAAIQLYNGASITRSLKTLDGTWSIYRSCWKFDENAPSGARWSFVANSENYVYKIAKEMEEISK